MHKFIRVRGRTRNWTRNNPWLKTISWRSWALRASLAAGPSCLGKGRSGTFLPSKSQPRKHPLLSEQTGTKSNSFHIVARPARVSDSPTTKDTGSRLLKQLGHGQIGRAWWRAGRVSEER